jgi:hypothetical protein
MPTETLNPEKYVAEHDGVADLQKLAMPHQIVRIRHTGDPLPNPMVVMDRFNKAHRFQPGEVKEVDLPISQIEHLRSLRRPGRKIQAAVQEGESYLYREIEAPPHPLVVEDIAP